MAEKIISLRDFCLGLLLITTVHRNVLIIVYFLFKILCGVNKREEENHTCLSSDDVHNDHRCIQFL